MKRALTRHRDEKPPRRDLYAESENFLVRRFGDEHTAADAAQETRIQAWKQWGTELPPRAWAYRVAINNYSRLATRQRREAAFEDLERTLRASPVALPQQAEDACGAARSAFVALSRSDQAVLALKRVARLKRRQIAAELRITPAAAQQRVTRARTRIRRHLSRVGIGPLTNRQLDDLVDVALSDVYWPQVEAAQEKVLRQLREQHLLGTDESSVEITVRAHEAFCRVMQAEGVPSAIISRLASGKMLANGKHT